jgi:hypothetical protein
MTWCERQRLDWIADTLRVYGYLNRAHLRRKFGISEPQASHDLRTFARLYPRVMTYDVLGKRYVATEGPTP